MCKYAEKNEGIVRSDLDSFSYEICNKDLELDGIHECCNVLFHNLLESSTLFVTIFRFASRDFHVYPA